MLNKFVVVGISGLVVCGVCMAAAAAIGGQALRDLVLQNRNFENGVFDIRILDDIGFRPRCAFGESGKQASRELPWTGGDRVNIALPANIHYKRGSGEAVVVRGDSAALDHVRITHGDVIELDCRGAADGELDITLPGRDFRSFAIAGDGKMVLENIDQPELHLLMGGSTEITASGKTEKLDVKMGGSNTARLGGLQTGDARLDMGGSNDAEVSAKGDLTVNLGGDGTVQLKVEPRHLNTHIAGSGRIVHAGDL